MWKGNGEPFMSKTIDYNSWGWRTQPPTVLYLYYGVYGRGLPLAWSSNFHWKLSGFCLLINFFFFLHIYLFLVPICQDSTCRILWTCWESLSQSEMWNTYGALMMYILGVGGTISSSCEANVLKQNTEVMHLFHQAISLTPFIFCKKDKHLNGWSERGVETERPD